jgi:hypothetical protein
MTPLAERAFLIRQALTATELNTETTNTETKHQKLAITLTMNWLSRLDVTRGPTCSTTSGCKAPHHSLLLLLLLTSGGGSSTWSM